MPTIVTVAGSILSSAARDRRGILAGAVVGDEAVAIRRPDDSERGQRSS